MRNPAVAKRARWAVATVVLIAIAVLAVGNLWSTAGTLDDNRAAASNLSEGDAAVAGGKQYGLKVDFIEWIRHRLRRGETYFVPASHSPELVFQWLTYRLLPNRAVDRPGDADVIVFYGDGDTAASYSSQIGLPDYFNAPLYGIARTR
jgi:hypothetical protein